MKGGIRASHAVGLLIFIFLSLTWLVFFQAPSVAPSIDQSPPESTETYDGALNDEQKNGDVYSELSRITKAFEASIKSCLGAQCFDEKSTDQPVSRIGFLSPDTHGVQELLDLVLIAGKNAKLIDGKRSAELCTNVPPYGYGKNHGWGRIIRIYSKLPEHALRILERSNKKNPSKNLYATQIEQLMRWHCRLNHVAAHSSMLSIFVDDFLERPVVELYKILSFMGVRPSQYDIEEAMESMEGRQALTALSESFGDVPRELIATAASQIGATTKKLSKWPCDSFRELESTSGERLPLPCKTLHPDCDNDLVSCLPIDKRGMCGTI